MSVVYFYCGDIKIGYSYCGWNKYREIIIKSAFDYIQDKFKKDFELYKNISDEKDKYYIGEGSTYNRYKLIIEEIIKLIETASKTNQVNVKHDIYEINNLIDIAKHISYIKKQSRNIFDPEFRVINTFIEITRNLDYVDALIYFGIDGLYSLCNKSDCEGFYSVGNSVDICQLFNLIEPFVKSNNADIYSFIYIQSSSYIRLYDLFKESTIKFKTIMIA